MRKSYYAKYWLSNGGVMIGGVTKSQTSRFGSRESVQARVDDIKELHRTDYTTAKAQFMYAILDTIDYPEIFAHCPGSPEQALGGKCPGCGKLLTVQDAMEWQQRGSNMTPGERLTFTRGALIGFRGAIEEIISNATEHSTGNAWIVSAQSFIELHALVDKINDLIEL